MSASNIAAAMVGHWERKAKGELYLDAMLHPVAKKWLVDAIAAALIEAGAGASKRASTGAGSGQVEMPVNTAPAAVIETELGGLKGKNKGKQRASK